MLTLVIIQISKSSSDNLSTSVPLEQPVRMFIPLSSALVHLSLQEQEQEDN
jgi:hypothetical protein